MKLRRTAAFVLFGLLLTAASLVAARDVGKLTGVVVDPKGNPQMGASVWLTPEFAGGRAIELLTDENGVFVSQRLHPGLYSVKVTLAGFMPSIQSHVSVGPNVSAPMHIELGSIFASLEQLRNKSGKSAESDDWKWVLRTASSSRPVLQLRDGTVVIAFMVERIAEVVVRLGEGGLQAQRLPKLSNGSLQVALASERHA